MIKSRRVRWTGHVARMRKLVGKPEEKRLLERSKDRWVINIKIDLKEIGWNDMD
jgi:hypothetical protein